MKFKVFQDDSSSCSEESFVAKSPSMKKSTLKQPLNQQATQPKAAVPVVKITEKIVDQPKSKDPSQKPGVETFKRLLQQDTTPLPQNKENYDYLRKTYSTDKKKSKSASDLKDLCRTPLEDITFHYQSRLKRTLLVNAFI